MFRLIRKVQPRLSQWTGRRRSSRGEGTVIPRPRRRAALARLAAVLATTVAVTLLAYFWGPPFPYRLGEVFPYDLRVRIDFDVVNIVALVNQAAAEKPPGKPRSSILTDPVLEQAQFTDRPVVEKYPRGMVLVPRGVPILERQLALLHREHEVYQASLGHGDHVRRGTALFVIFSLLAGLVVLYVARFQTGLAQNLPMIAGVCALVLATLMLSLLLSRPPWHAVFIPLSMTAMILTLAYNPQFALLMSLSLALAVTVALGSSLGQLLELMGGLAPVVLLLRTVHTRTQLIKVATASGFAYLLMTLATGLLSGQTRSFIVSEAFRHFLWGALAGFVLTGLLPLVERAFGIVTDISLLELADGSHPLLQELVRRAPGTYTHSITVATLAETAAEAIGANPLLTRVGSYFHDVGKMLKPHYFIENQTGENLHDSLEPALSTLVILGHVKDGLALGKQYKLPRPILDFIAQHHGTTLVEYFYREAMRAQEDKGMEPAELEASYRYPGPKPQTRETGIIMLADAVESSSRALANIIPGSLRKLVHDLVMKRLLDGQFEESGLTLTELHRVEESLCKSLIALFHARIKYPDTAPEQKAS
jgi:putative nucleotidyltransferase with HDIG domain